MWVDDRSQRHTTADAASAAGAHPAYDADSGDEDAAPQPKRNVPSPSAPSISGVSSVQTYSLASSTPSHIPAIPNFELYAKNKAAAAAAAAAASYGAPTPPRDSEARHLSPRRASSVQAPAAAAAAAQLPPCGDDDDLLCPLCLELFDTPLTLPCGHCVCRACVRSVAGGDGGGGGGGGVNDASNSSGGGGGGGGGGGNAATLLCPVCTEVHSLGAPLPVSRTMARRLAEALEVSSGPPPPPPLCEKCEQHEAAVGCEVCDVVLCGACNAQHHRGSKLSAHELTDVATYSRGASAGVPFCPTMGHGRYRQDLICVDTGRLLCLLCYQMGRDGAGGAPAHRNVIPVGQAVERCKAELAECVRDVAGLKGEVRGSIAKVDRWEHDVREATLRGVQRLRADFKRLRAEIDQQEYRVVGALTKTKDSQIAELRRVRGALRHELTHANVGVARAQHALSGKGGNASPDAIGPAKELLATSRALYKGVGEALKAAKGVLAHAEVDTTRQSAKGQASPQSRGGGGGPAVLPASVPLLALPAVVTMKPSEVRSFAARFASVQYAEILPGGGGGGGEETNGPLSASFSSSSSSAQRRRASTASASAAPALADPYGNRHSHSPQHQQQQPLASRRSRTTAAGSSQGSSRATTPIVSPRSAALASTPSAVVRRAPPPARAANGHGGARTAGAHGLQEKTPEKMPFMNIAAFASSGRQNKRGTVCGKR